VNTILKAVVQPLVLPQDIGSLSPDDVIIIVQGHNTTPIKAKALAYYNFENLKELRKDVWLDVHSRGVFLEFTVYNPNLNLFGSMIMLVEFMKSGGAVYNRIFQWLCLIIIKSYNRIFQWLMFNYH
jgi:hypothetical protein